jgi:hypothetical protein
MTFVSKNASATLVRFETVEPEVGRQTSAVLAEAGEQLAARGNRQSSPECRYFRLRHRLSAA